jgi:hypothetical protein
MLPPSPLAALPLVEPAVRRLGALLARASLPDSRSQRVAMLVIACSIMGLADLYLTLNFVMNMGMIELNPIARAVIELGCPKFVIAWKVVLILLSSGILWWARHHRFAEIGAWICCAILVTLTLHWVGFVSGVAAMGDDYYAILAVVQEDHRYVMLEAN